MPPNHYLVRYEKDKNAASVIPSIDTGGCFDDIACDALLQCPEDSGRADHHPYTLHAFRTDTVRLSTHHSRTDTVRESMVQVITLRQDSAHTDTVRVETLRERWHTVHVADNTDAYRHLVDSLQAMKDRQMVKRQTVWRYYPVKWWFIALLLMAVAFVALKYLSRRSRHSSDV